MLQFGGKSYTTPWLYLVPMKSHWYKVPIRFLFRINQWFPISMWVKIQVRGLWGVPLPFPQAFAPEAVHNQLLRPQKLCLLAQACFWSAFSVWSTHILSLHLCNPFKCCFQWVLSLGRETCLPIPVHTFNIFLFFLSCCFDYHMIYHLFCSLFVMSVSPSKQNVGFYKEDLKK